MVNERTVDKVLGMVAEKILTLATVGIRNHIYFEEKNKQVSSKMLFVK